VRLGALALAMEVVACKQTRSCTKTRKRMWQREDKSTQMVSSLLLLLLLFYVKVVHVVNLKNYILFNLL
jgi:hypothetical protein